jgi:TonB family protein
MALLGHFFPVRAIVITRSQFENAGAWRLALLIEGYFEPGKRRRRRNTMHQWNQTTGMARPKAGFATTQSRRLQIALVLLLLALAVVVATDRDFWFGSEQASDSDVAEPETQAKSSTAASTVKTAEAPAAQAANAKKQLAPKTSTAPASTASGVAAPSQQAAANSTSPVVSRTVLPPLDVEVVAGDTHRTVHPGSNVAKVEISGSGDSNRVSTDAAGRERLVSAAVPELRQTIDSNLPLLGQHSKVQGSVVLQAVVGADGNIENLRVVSGPAILSAAAQQAVRQWRFKPYLQNGQPVETKARITVNFSIKISDDAAKTT